MPVDIKDSDVLLVSSCVAEIQDYSRTILKSVFRALKNPLMKSFFCHST